ncbi:Leucine-rich repeat domain, L domain-like [Phytophthora cactorum]|nr:Leucine-rich repeat domain, L domain-like [Phytophthora cactorum]
MANQRECEDSDQESVNFRGRGFTVAPLDLFSMKKVRRVDLSSNELTRFPGARVSQELPCLEVLVLSNNLLHVLKDILALASAPRLCELDLRGNPLRLSHNRLYLLESLLFHDTILDEEILRELHRDESLKNFTSVSQPLRKILYRSRLPRRRGFPMLQVLNRDWISDSESRQAELERGKTLEYFRPVSHGGKKSKSTAHTETRKKTSVDKVKGNERRFDGSRMTVKQMLRNEARITAIPLPQVLKRYQIDTESCKEVRDESDTTTDSPPTKILENQVNNENQGGSEEDDDEHKLLQQLFRPLSLVSDTTKDQPQAPAESKPSSDLEPWNYPISTFDDLHSDERHYVRYKSKHVGGTLERDDHFFESTTFLDCVAQCERSRRLTIRAVDLLTQPLGHAIEMPSNLNKSRLTKSTPTLPISEAAATLAENLTANFSKRRALESFERVKDFQRRQVTVGEYQIEAEVGDYLLGEQIALRQKTNQLLSGQATNELRWHENAHGIEASLEESLSKVKLRNAVDLANTLGGSKEQKRLFQALIDADAKVIEEERVTEEHKSHRQRLRRINSRQVVNPQTRRDVELAKKPASLHAESPWQERNWKSKMKLLQRKRDENDHIESTSVPSVRREKRKQQSRTQANAKPSPVSPTVTPSTNSSKDFPATQVPAKFRTIETVEKAAQDPMVEVNSHDLLVRCSEIRQNKDKHVRSLAMYRDHFHDEEAEWEHMRQDPINVVRRHLRRKLYQDVQQIQIGTMEYVFSPVFQ